MRETSQNWNMPNAKVKRWNMSNVEDLVFVSKSNPHKGRWSTLPEDGALQRSQCWVQYCSQVVDSAIAIVHHSTDYVTICHYIYLYIYIYVMVFTLRCYLVVCHFTSRPSGLWGSGNGTTGTTGTTGTRPNLKMYYCELNSDWTKKQNTKNKANLEDATKSIDVHTEKSTMVEATWNLAIYSVFSNFPCRRQVRHAGAPCVPCPKRASHFVAPSRPRQSQSS